MASSPVRFVAGNAGIQWLAQALAAAVPAKTARSVTVVLVEPPERAAAALLQCGAAASLDDALTAWVADVAASLAAHGASAGPVQYVQGPSSAPLAALLAAKAGESVPLLAGLQTPEVDEALCILARRAVAGRPDVAAALQRLDTVGLSFETPPRARPRPQETGETRLEAGPPGTHEFGPALVLEQCLLDAQRELESTHLQLMAARAALAARSTVGAGVVNGEDAANAETSAADPAALQTEVRMLDVRLTMDPPEQPGATLAAEVQMLEVGSKRRLPRVQATVSLVGDEPELRLYAAGTDPEVVSAWHHDGTADGRPFMRFMPADPASRLRLQHLGTADWLVVSSVIDLLRSELDSLSEIVPWGWRVIVARLRRQLSVLPARFRYDALMVSEETLPTTGLSLTFEGAWYGGRWLGAVRLLWVQGCLHWIQGERTVDPPLVSWPMTSAGQLAPRWTLPLGQSPLGRDARWAVWHRLPDEDLGLVMAVLDALPACAAVATEAQAGRFGGRSKLAAAAAAWLREAHKLRDRGTQGPRSRLREVLKWRFR